MTFYALPTGGIQSADWTPPEPLAFVVRSGWTGKQTVGDLGGIRAGWQCRLTIIPGKLAHRQKWSAFVALMRGPVNTTAIAAVETNQVASGAAVNITGFSTTTMGVSGLPASQTPYLPAGALAQVSTTGSGGGQRLVTLLADLNTDGSGVGTITFQPPLPVLTTGANLVIYKPTATMRLVAGEAGWSVSPGGIYQPKVLDFEEVL